MSVTLIGREKELEFLKKEFDRNRFSFIPIYGRRRVGKTTLVKEFMKNTEGIYFLCREVLYKQNLKALSKVILEKYPSKIIKNFEDIEQVIMYLSELNKNVCLVIDEFPNLIKSRSSITSELQYVIDETDNEKVMLILVGSSISMMESHVLSYKSPLYGRRTGQIKLSPLSFKHSFKLAGWPIEEFVKVYGITGGVPYYLNMALETKNFRNFVEDMVFDYSSILYIDADYILNQELREPKTYKSILDAIAKGNNKFSKIINETGIQKTHLISYVDVLVSLDLIKMERSVLSSEKSKDKRYVFKDNYFWFYFSLLNKYREYVESRDYSFLGDFYKEYNTYLGRVFENTALEIIKDLNVFKYTKIGRWWHKDKEIDIVAVNEDKKEMMAVEVKWKDLGLREVKEIVKDLEGKVRYVDWFNSERRERIGIFARKMEKSAKEWLKEKGYLGWDLVDIENEL